MKHKKKKRLERKAKRIMREVQSIYDLQEEACYTLNGECPYTSDDIWETMLVKTAFIYSLRRLQERYSDLEVKDFFGDCECCLNPCDLVYNEYCNQLFIAEDVEIENAVQLASASWVFCDILLSVMEYFGWETYDIFRIPDFEKELKKADFCLTEVEREYLEALMSEESEDELHICFVKNQRLESLASFVKAHPLLKKDTLIQNIAELAQYVGNPFYCYLSDYVAAFTFDGKSKEDGICSRFYFASGYYAAWDRCCYEYYYSPFQLLLVEKLEQLLHLAAVSYPEWKISQEEYIYCKGNRLI